MNDIKICFTASSGGHTSESLQLQELRKKYPNFFVTEGTPNRSREGSVYYIKQINRKEISSIFYFFYLFVYAWKLLKKEKPTHIISTGAMCTFPFCFIGKIRGCKIIYIESFARVYSLSVTGRLVYLFCGCICGAMEAAGKKSSESSLLWGLILIFVILGTQKFQFNRLLQMIDSLVEKKVITEPVFAQIGYSTYLPKNYEYRDFLPEQEFKEKISNSRYVISHGGIGSMMSCLERGKRVIVVPRNMLHDEHVDNHQYQLASLFKRRGHVLMAENEKQLIKVCNEIEQFRPLPYEAQRNYIEETLEQYILEGYVVKNKRVLMVGSDLSVKGGIVSVIKNYLGSEGWEDWDAIFVPTHVEGSAVAKVFCFVKALGKIQKLIRKHKIPLVHIHVSERGSFIRKAIVIKMARRKGCKVILHHHGAEFQQYYDGSKDKHKKFIAETLEGVDLNIVLSERLKPMIQKMSPKANVKVLYNSVGVSSVNRYNAKARDFIMLGRLEQRKGTFGLLETIAKLDEKLPKDIKFHLCGDGDLAKVQEAIDRLQIAHRIGHFGWADAEMKDELLKECMGHILFSYNEGLPMAILETMGYGIPSISTNVASIPEVVKTDETGILIEPGDKEALEQAILKFASEEDYRKVLSENSHRLIYEKFSLVNGVKALQDYYREVLS